MCVDSWTKHHAKCVVTVATWQGLLGVRVPSMVPHAVNELPWLLGKIRVDQEAPSILPVLPSILLSLVLHGVPSILQSLVLDVVQKKVLIYVGILKGLPRQEILSLGLLATQLEPVTRCQQCFLQVTIIQLF